MVHSPHRLVALIVHTIVLTFSLTQSIQSATERWESITSFSTVRQMLFERDTIFAATSGGLLVIPDTVSQPKLYLNTDGLGTTDLNDIIEDQDGQQWIAGYGQLIKWSPDHPERFPFNNQNGPDRLLSLADDGDQLWVGTEHGLVLFSKTIDGGQFQDRYGITLINSFPIIYDIWLDGNTIWLATSTGLARGDKSNPNQLKSPANWQIFNSSTDSIMVNDPVFRVLRFESHLFFGTARGNFEVVVDSLGDSSVVMLSYGADRLVYDMRIDNDTLFLYQAGGPRLYKNGAPVILSIGGLTAQPTAGVNTGSMRWFALAGGGIAYSQGSGFATYPYTGLPYNTVTDVEAGAGGTIAAAFDEFNRLGVRDGNIWTLYNTVRSFTTQLAKDSTGAIWVGTWGNGMYRLIGDSLVNYDETNSTVRGIGPEPGNIDYAVVRDISFDKRFVYAASYLAYTGYPVAIGDMNNLNSPAGWDSIGLADGLTDIRLTSIDTRNNYVAIGTEDNGVFLCHMSYNNVNRWRADNTVHFLESNYFLVSNNIRAVRFSSDGVLWVGTNFGISRYDDGIERFVDINLPAGFGPDITSLAFDVRDNVWAASSNGVARIDATTGAIDVFTTENSGLLSNQVNAVTVDLATNNLYASTPDGISVHRSSIGEPTPDIEQVIAFPNPFVIDDPSDRLRFNYAGNATVKLFNEAGDPVAEFPVNLPWDGRNNSGREVASGVYLFLLSNENVEIGRGKILVIRK